MTQKITKKFVRDEKVDSFNLFKNVYLILTINSDHLFHGRSIGSYSGESHGGDYAKKPNGNIFPNAAEDFTLFSFFLNEVIMTSSMLSSFAFFKFIFACEKCYYKLRLVRTGYMLHQNYIQALKRTLIQFNNLC